MLIQSTVAILLFSLLGPAGDTRISDAAQNGNLAVIQTLIKEKADVNAPQGDGTTALHWAAYREDVPMARLLIQAGADAKARTRLGSVTALHLAATTGNPQLVDLLLKAGAETDAANGNGTTPLMLTAASGNVEAIKLLSTAAPIRTRGTQRTDRHQSCLPRP